MTSKRVVVCSWSDGQGAIAVGSEEALSLGRKVAGALDSKLRWLVLGPQPEGLLETAERFGVAGDRPPGGQPPSRPSPRMPT